MILALRTDKPESELYLVEKGEVVEEIVWPAHRQLADTVHIKINELLKTKELELNDINGIVVFKGPGSFTGLRIGISVANALAYALKVPIVGDKGEDWLKKGITKINNHNDKIVLPEYGGEVNITKPKK